MSTVRDLNLRLERLMELELPEKRDHHQLKENLLKMEVRWKVKEEESEVIYGQMEQLMANDSKLDSMLRFWETKIDLAQLKE